MADREISGLFMEGSRFEGKLSFKNEMRINGEFKGEIVSEDQLTVGKSAHISADIKVDRIIVWGKVEGTISNCAFLEIKEGGSVMADIQVRTLDIKPGAVFDGKCNMPAATDKKPSKAGKA